MPFHSVLHKSSNEDLIYSHFLWLAANGYGTNYLGWREGQKSNDTAAVDGSAVVPHAPATINSAPAVESSNPAASEAVDFTKKE